MASFFLAMRGLLLPLTPAIEATTGHLKYSPHGRDSKIACILVHKHILHFRLLAKYVAAFFTMASSSACSASWRLRRAISPASCCSTSLRSWAARASVLQLYSCDSCSPSSLAALATPTFSGRASASARYSGACCRLGGDFFPVCFIMIHLCSVVYSLQ